MLSLDTQLAAGRALSWGAASMVFGSLVFIAAIWPAGAAIASARRLLVGTWLGGAIALAWTFVVGAAQANATGLPGTMSTRTLRGFASSDAGAGPLTRMLLWLLTLAVVLPLCQRGEQAARSLGWRVGALAVGLGFARAVGLGDDHDGWLTGTADMTHVLGIFVWLGGLAFLCAVVLPRRRAEELAAVLPHWARVARTSVGVVIAGGLVLAWQHLGGVRPLFTSGYGHTLIVKLLLVASLLGAAYLSKTWVEHRLRLAVVLNGDRQTVQPLVMSVALEVVIAIPVLVAAAALVGGHPPA